MKMIIMAGGSGTRLWPLSRTFYPKQFLKLPDMDKSIFQMTIERCLLMGSIDDIYLVTSKDYLQLIQSQSVEIGHSLPIDQILLEPEAKNTLPAIMYAVQAIREKGDDICAVFASDHVIDNPKVMVDTITSAIPFASKGFVCFGLKPSRPETGFGYIKPGEIVDGGFIVSEFKEKPDYETASQYVKNGYLWNSGMFIFHSNHFNDAVKKYNPEVYEAFQESDVEMKFKKTPKISVDYGLTEKMETVFVVPMELEWNDIGSFTTLYDRYQSQKDDNGNVCFNDEIILDSSNNFIYTESDKAIAVVGVSDIIVIEQEDTLLICKQDKAPMINRVVEILKERKDKRVDRFGK